MSSDEILVASFISIAGEDITVDEAKRYLKMGKNNLEAALNYFFNKKIKSEKSTPPPPANAFQMLQQGSKKQAHVEKIIKDLKQDFQSNDIEPSKLNPHKTPDSLKVSKYPNPDLGDLPPYEPEPFTFPTVEVKAPSKPQTESKDAKQTPSEMFDIRTQLSGTKIGNRMQEDIRLDEDFDFRSSQQEIRRLDPPPKTMEVEEDEEKEPEPQPRRSTRVRKSPSPSPLPSQSQTKNNLKRNFRKFEEEAEKLDSVIENKKEEDDLEEKKDEMVLETSVQDNNWPKFLGRIVAKANVMTSLHYDVYDGNQVQLRREKQKQNIPTKKGGFKNQKPITNSSAIVRVLFNEEEIGKLDTEFSHTFAPLLDRSYIFVEATVRTAPTSWSYFSPFWIYVDVYLSDSVISKPLTEIFSLKENSKDSEDLMLQQLQYTKDSFVNLFDMLKLNKVTETLIKRLPTRQSHAAEPESSSAKKEANAAKVHYSEKQNSDEKKVDIFDPFQKVPQQKSLAGFVSKKPEGSDHLSVPSEASTNTSRLSPTKNEQRITEESSDVNYEKLLNLENDDYDDLKLSEPPPSFVSTLHSYQKQALTWMLSREGCNEKLYNKMNDKNRVIHPLWEEYVLKDNTHIFFNPYTGQVSTEIPKAAPDCLGGILADEMGLGKTVMMISLLHSHKYDKGDVTIFKKQAEKKRKANAVKGQTGLNFSAKPALKPAGNLIIVPVTLLAQWESEIELHSANRTLRTFIYYADKRSEGKGDLGKYDVVLTTYGILSNEAASNGEKELYKYEWFRIILDEAHYIKGRTIQTAKAVYELSGIHKWCLSGTPIQNKLDDMFSLIHFLKLEPWSDYVWWNTYINKPNEKNDPIVFQILQTILRPILLRRTKKTQGKDGQLIIQLPEKTAKIEYITLSAEERDFYDSLFKKSKTEFDKFVQEGTLVSHYAHVFELLLRLRQTCDHPYLIFSNPDVKGKESLEDEIMKFIEKKNESSNNEDSDDSGKQNKKGPKAIEEEKERGAGNHVEIIMDEGTNAEQVIPVQNSGSLFNKKFIKETIEKLKNGEMENCVVCLSDIEDAVITVCSHVLCRYCLIRAIDMTSMCPICRTILTKKDFMTVPR